MITKAGRRIFLKLDLRESTKKETCDNEKIEKHGMQSELIHELRPSFAWDVSGYMHTLCDDDNYQNDVHFARQICDQPLL